MEQNNCKINCQSEERCLQKMINAHYKEIKELPMVKQFVKEKENEKLLNKAFEKGDLTIINRLNSAFQSFLKKHEAIKYVMGIIKRYPIDYDKRVKKRNSRTLLILDKTVKSNDDSSATSIVELINDPKQEESYNNILQDSIFSIENESLKNVVNSLNPKQKTILKLIYEENYSQREISKIIGQTEQNIYYWHKKTIKQLQSALILS